MAVDIIETEWNELFESDFDTTDLLRAADAVDELRGELNAGEAGRPPQQVCVATLFAYGAA